MSLRTCSWLLPQNEQRYGTLELLLPPVVLNPSALVLFLRLGLGALGAGRRSTRFRVLRRTRDARSLPAGQARVVGLGDEGRSGQRVDRIDDAIVLRLFRRHESVTIGVPLDRLDRLARGAGGGRVGPPGGGVPV